MHTAGASALLTYDYQKKAIYLNAHGRGISAANL